MRVSAILNVLADDPERSYSLSDIARSAGLSLATAHSFINSLVDEGMLARDSTRKRYTLGPTLVRLGRAAEMRRDDVTDSARVELEEVSATLGRQIIATRAVGDYIVVAAKHGDPGLWGMSVQIGQRLPMAPPLGTVFVAWSATDRIRSWLGAVSAPPSLSALDRCVEALAAVRTRGWAVSLDVGQNHGRFYTDDGRSALHSGLTDLLESNYFLNRLDAENSYSVRQISVPVFDVAGEVTLALAAMYMGDPRSGREIADDAGALVDAAGRITDSIRGRPPTPGARSK
ncbi:MAG: helix-turn-helix domain-containing protein [Rhodococcus fascians]